MKWGKDTRQAFGAARFWAGQDMANEVRAIEDAFRQVWARIHQIEATLNTPDEEDDDDEEFEALGREIIEKLEGLEERVARWEAWGAKVDRFLNSLIAAGVGEYPEDEE